MRYFPSLESISKQAIITVVSLILAGVVISKFPALQRIVNPSN